MYLLTNRPLALANPIDGSYGSHRDPVRGTTSDVEVVVLPAEKSAMTLEDRTRQVLCISSIRVFFIDMR